MTVPPAKTQISLGIRPVWSVRCLHEDQPGHSPSPVSPLSARRNLGSNHWAHSEAWSDWVAAQADLSLCWGHTVGRPKVSSCRQRTDQTGRMPRLIWVFAVRTCHFVGFVMKGLELWILSTSCLWEMDLTSRVDFRGVVEDALTDVHSGTDKEGI